MPSSAENRVPPSEERTDVSVPIFAGPPWSREALAFLIWREMPPHPIECSFAAADAILAALPEHPVIRAVNAEWDALNQGAPPPPPPPPPPARGTNVRLDGRRA